MKIHRFAATRGHALRAITASLLAAGLLVGITGPTTPPARADHEPVRLEVEVKSVHVLNDQDFFGSGELWLGGGVSTCDVRATVNPCWRSEDYPPQSVGGFHDGFSADSDETVTLNHVFPRPGDWLGRVEVSEGGVGFPVFHGHAYKLNFGMGEGDPTAVELAQCFTFVMCDPDPHIGDASMDLDEQQDWGIGSHTLPSTGRCRWIDWWNIPPETHFGPCFEVTFEIRHAPLPDLHPTSIEVLPNPGGGQNVCLGVENLGQRDAGPFEMVFRVDSMNFPGGTVAGGGVPAGQGGKLCLPASLPAAGRHQLSVTVDSADNVPELDTHNNVLSQIYLPGVPGALGLDSPTLATDPGPSSGPTVPGVGERGDDRVVTGTTPTADLVVSAIRVPGGANDCDPGKNDVTVIVKNEGGAAAAGFAVRVFVDDKDDEAKEKSGLTVDASKELTVKVDDLRIPKGDHKLTATADASNAIAESNEANNEMKTMVRCKDD
jgi:hypothetical protein